MCGGGATVVACVPMAMVGTVEVTTLVAVAAAVAGTKEGEATERVVGTGRGDDGAETGTAAGVGGAAGAAGEGEVLMARGADGGTAFTVFTKLAMAAALSRARAASRAACASKNAGDGGASWTMDRTARHLSVKGCANRRVCKVMLPATKLTADTTPSMDKPAKLVVTRTVQPGWGNMLAVTGGATGGATGAVAW